MAKTSILRYFRLPGKGVYPAAPEGSCIYAIGDIHGRDDLLAALHEVIDADRIRHQDSKISEVYLGDYIDRGLQSAGVIERLVARAGSRSGLVFLRGNHEQTLIDFCRGAAGYGDLTSMGGLTTLASYGLSAGLGRWPDEDGLRAAVLEAIPKAHMDFLNGTRPFLKLGEYILVHAGIRPGIALEKQAEEDLFWIRDDFLNHPGRLGGIVVHGHTPVEEIQFHANRINIDTGAYITNCLTCLRISDKGPEVLHITGARSKPGI